MIQLSELYAREKNGDVQYMFFIKVPSKLETPPICGYVWGGVGRFQLANLTADFPAMFEVLPLHEAFATF
jgi:hypothetical protein